MAILFVLEDDISLWQGILGLTFLFWGVAIEQWKQIFPLQKRDILPMFYFSITIGPLAAILMIQYTLQKDRGDDFIFNGTELVSKKSF